MTFTLCLQIHVIKIKTVQMTNMSEEQIYKIGSVLNDPTRHLKERFRALFTLRNIGGASSINCIEQCFTDPSVLLKHELAYCLGQMQDVNANCVLREVLEDIKQDPMVRHEAAEALGAIGSHESVTVLEKYKNDPAIEVAETCVLALERIRMKNCNKLGNDSKSPYNSVDPAPPTESTNVEELKAVLLDEKQDIFQRYQAMFSLRNLQTREAVSALCAALKYGSALFRHEIAFVLGQLQDEHSIPYLKESLEDNLEHEMVRHECAEALGAIANSECISILNKFLGDERAVVRESCEVALDMCDYENSPEFQYANTLNTVH